MEEIARRHVQRGGLYSQVVRGDRRHMVIPKPGGNFFGRVQSRLR